MAKVHAYLNFNGDCEQAFKFYETVFDTQNTGMHRMGDMPPSPDFQVPESAKDKVMHTALFVNESTMIMGSDVVEEFGQKYVQGNNVYVMLDTGSAEEAKKLFDRLSVNAKVMEMPLGEQFFAELFASFVDQFGIPWMIHFEGNKAQPM
ncbi:VOC family protein [Empedobacter brevis]|uniref:VOC family protein n=1 Tax=Empedobacter brevis TaxID=247 RepID=UPI0028A2B6E1|nr:VOC family protein [Empedobacter brevis]